MSTCTATKPTYPITSFVHPANHPFLRPKIWQNSETGKKGIFKLPMWLVPSQTGHCSPISVLSVSPKTDFKRGPEVKFWLKTESTRDACINVRGKTPSAIQGTKVTHRVNRIHPLAPKNEFLPPSLGHKKLSPHSPSLWYLKGGKRIKPSHSCTSAWLFSFFSASPKQPQTPCIIFCTLYRRFWFPFFFIQSRRTNHVQRPYKKPCVSIHEHEWVYEQGFLYKRMNTHPYTHSVLTKAQIVPACACTLSTVNVHLVTT